MRATFLVALCLPLLGCPPSGDDDDGPSTPEAQYCDATPTPGPDEREVEIGMLEGTSFTPWADGIDVALQTGGQGGTMVVVSLRVPATAEDGDEACWVVTLDNEVSASGAGDIGDLKAAYEFQRNGDHMQVDGIYDLLGYGSEGLADNELTLRATIAATDFSAEDTVVVTLR